MKRKLIIGLVIGLLTLTMALLAFPVSAADPIEIEKVPVDEQPTDLKLLSHLEEEGVDKEYIQLDKDYGSRLEGKSPYSVTYKDLKSNKYYMLVSGLPHSDAIGNKLYPKWFESGGVFYSQSTDKTHYNLFWARVDGNTISVVAECDQPNGTLKGDWVTWSPQLFINGKEIQPRALPVILPVDPINPSYLNNTIEWDYGDGIKRTVRLIEGRIREWWTFDSNPIGEIRIKHNISGDLPLILGRGNDASGESLEITVTANDEEIVSVEELNKAFYPIRVGASPETFYPDPDPENTSVDGVVGVINDTLTWTAAVEHAGTHTWQTADYYVCQIKSSVGSANKWRLLYRGIFLFDTSGLPDGATITAAVMSVYGTAKLDEGSITPNIGVYASNPADNDALVAGDFDSFYHDGADTVLSNVITYAGWDTAGYNDFTLIDVDADDFGYIPVDGVTKLGTRNAEYDAARSEPAHPGLDKASRLMGYFADQGDTGSDPKLVVTYTEIPAAPTNVDATDGDHTDKVVITWTKSTGATKYEVFRGVVGLGELGDVATFDDSGATAGAITNAGTVTASDGTQTAHIVLSLASEATGTTTHSYTVKAGNADGWSGASGADNGNRGVGAITYQWQRSAGDADGGYGNIGGATTDPYNDSAAPAGTVTPGTASASDGTSATHITLSLAGESVADGAGRYFQCIVSATGASNSPQTSDNNRGYRGTGAITYAWQVSAGDSDAVYGALGGATTDPYNDTTAPANGDGRWYYCEVSATGTTTQDSTHNRGYRAVAATVITESCTGFGLLWGIINGNIEDEGTSGVTQVGFDYGLSTAYGNSWTSTGEWTTGDDFWTRLFPLTPATVYHYRAKAYNGFWGYGADRVFSTQGSPTLYEYLNTGGDGDSHAIYSANWTAEQFTSANISHTVTSIRVPLKRVGTYPGTVALALTYADSDNFSTGADLTVAYLNGDAMSDIAYVWYDFDVSDITLAYDTSYAVVVRATSGNATDYILWQKDTGGALADAVGSHSMDSGISWVSDSPTDYLFEIWGEIVMSVEDAQVFTGYIEEGDWLVVCTYKNTFEPYYPTDDVETYFDIQLLDDTTIKAQVNCPMWGYRPASIYISKAQADTLDWGNTDYKVRLIGSFGANPSADYSLTALDWTGGELTFLDKWIIAQANDIGEEDNTVLTVDIADKGEVLNATGHTIFSLGIPGLNEVRTDLFEMVVLTPSHEEEEYTHAMTGAADWEVKLGATLSGILTTWGAFMAMDGQTFGGVLTFVGFVVVFVALAAIGAWAAGLAFGYVILLGGAWLGLINWVLIGVITFVAFLIFVWQRVLTR